MFNESNRVNQNKYSSFGSRIYSLKHTEYKNFFTYEKKSHRSVTEKSYEQNVILLGERERGWGRKSLLVSKIPDVLSGCYVKLSTLEFAFNVNKFCRIVIENNWNKIFPYYLVRHKYYWNKSFVILIQILYQIISFFSYI